MTWPDPWPDTPEKVREWKISDPYDRYFKRRADVIEDLFTQDVQSIDAIALCGVALGTLAEFRFLSEMPKAKRRDKDQYCFRRLLVEHCPSFVNRMSIQELLRATRRDTQYAPFEQVVKAQYTIQPGYSVRYASHDPTADEFIEWASKQSPKIPEALLTYDYAGCIHRHYRNSVIHELRVANGREAGYFGPDAHEGPIYYTNGPDEYADASSDDGAERFMNSDPVRYMRFGVYPPYLLKLLREAIAALREWSLSNDRHIFPEDD